LEKVAKTVAEPKNAKISTSELKLKVQNIPFKPLFNLNIPSANHIFKLVIKVSNVKKYF
jgi:hypothetical protein